MRVGAEICGAELKLRGGGAETGGAMVVVGAGLEISGAGVVG
jgi:hypothetical protein